MHVLAVLSVVLGLLRGPTPTGSSYLCSADGAVHATCRCVGNASGTSCGENDETPAPCGPRDAVAEGSCCVVVPSSGDVDPTWVQARDRIVLPAAVADGFTVVEVSTPARHGPSPRRSVGAAYRATPLYVLHESLLI